jgi:putative ABC transport system ATP-binding protein
MSSSVSASAPQRANATSVLKVVNLTKQVSSPEGPLAIVHDVTFDIARGETVAITGASGAGKSTLLAMLAGLDLPTTGHLWLDGQDLTTLSEDGRARLRAQRVGFVFQSFHLIPSLTALENVLLPLELAQRDNARTLAREALDRVGLSPRVAHYPRQLSGGEQQRVALARAFVIGPAVLFADEPTGNLDANTGQRIIEMMFDMNRTARTTLVLVTHEQPLAARCDRILHMHAGRLVTP